jgi:WD40 repeat protein
LNSPGERVWFSESGSRLSTLSTTGEVQSWNIAEDGHLREAGDFTTSDFSFAEPSRDGSLLALLVEDSVRVWDMESGRETATFDVCADNAYAAHVVWGPDRARLAASCEPTSNGLERASDGVTLIDLATRETIVLDAGYPTDLVLSADGRLLATTGESVPMPRSSRRLAAFFDTFDYGTAVSMWDVETGARTADYELGDGLADVVFSPDSESVAFAFPSGTEGVNPRVELWDLGASGPRLTFDVNSLSTDPLAFAPDGATLVVNTGFGASLWDAQRGDEVLPLQLACSGIYGTMFSPDGQFVAAVCQESSGPPTIAVVDVESGSQVKLAAHSATLTEVAFGPDGSLASVARSETGAESVVALWSRDGVDRVVSDVASLAAENPHVALTPDGTTALEYSFAGSVVLWATADGSRLGLVSCPSTDELLAGQVAEMSGSLLACASGERTEIEIHDTGTGKLKRTFAHDTDDAGHPVAFTDLALSPDGEILAAAYAISQPDGSPVGESSILVWRIADGTRLAELEGRARDLAISGDGSLLAAAIGTAIAVYDTATWSRVATLVGDGGEVLTVGFDSQGQELASGDSNGAVITWDATSWKQRSVLRAHKGSVLHLAFGSDGSLATTDSTGLTYIWDAGRHLPFGPLPELDTLGFDPNGALLASRGDRIIRWHLGTENMKAAACDFADRDLTEDEWQLYLTDEAYQPTCP